MTHSTERQRGSGGKERWNLGPTHLSGIQLLLTAKMVKKIAGSKVLLLGSGFGMTLYS
jgi:hypothetical protein